MLDDRMRQESVFQSYNVVHIYARVCALLGLMPNYEIHIYSCNKFV